MRSNLIIENSHRNIKNYQNHKNQYFSTCLVQLLTKYEGDPSSFEISSPDNDIPLKNLGLTPLTSGVSPGYQFRDRTSLQAKKGSAVLRLRNLHYWSDRLENWTTRALWLSGETVQVARSSSHIRGMHSGMGCKGHLDHGEFHRNRALPAILAGPHQLWVARSRRKELCQLVWVRMGGR